MQLICTIIRKSFLIMCYLEMLHCFLNGTSLLGNWWKAVWWQISVHASSSMYQGFCPSWARAPRVQPDSESARGWLDFRHRAARLCRLTALLTGQGTKVHTQCHLWDPAGFSSWPGVKEWPCISELTSHREISLSQRWTSVRSPTKDCLALKPPPQVSWSWPRMILRERVRVMLKDFPVAALSIDPHCCHPVWVPHRAKRVPFIFTVGQPDHSSACTRPHRALKGRSH